MPEMTKLAKSVREHLDGIVESVRQRATSSYAEGLNNKIRTAFRRAYGFKAKEYRDIMIYSVAGRLSLHTHNVEEKQLSFILIFIPRITISYHFQLLTKLRSLIVHELNPLDYILVLGEHPPFLLRRTRT